MKILVISMESPDHIYGGLGEHVRQLYRHMDIDITLLCLDEVDDNKPYSVFRPNIKSYDLPIDDYSRMVENIRKMTLEGIKILNKDRHDIIHAHDWSSVQIALDLKDVFNIPVVTTFHLFQHQIQKIENLPLTRDTDYAIRMELEGLFSSDRVILCSDFMRRYAINKMCIKREYDIIPNTIDVTEMTPKNPKRYSNLPTVLFSGRLSKQKGIELLFDVMKKTNKFYFLIMGQVPTWDKMAKEEHIFTKTLSKLSNVSMFNQVRRVKHLGHLTGQDRWDIYHSADIGLMPSLAEPYGIVAKEFMACKVPLVTTGVDGMDEFITNNNAILIKPTVKSILEGLDLALKIGKNITHNAYLTATKISWKEVADWTIEVYKEVIEKWHTSDLMHQQELPITN